MSFKQCGLEKIYNLISPELAKFCNNVLFLRYNAYKILKPLGTAERNFPVYQGLTDQQTNNTFSEYCSDVGDTLLTLVQPKIEEVVGEKLLPCYSYNRIYFSGSDLKPHSDRPSCEISVTLNLSIIGEIWPIYFKGADGLTVYEVILDQGDGAVYNGSELVHWREELKENNIHTQMFLHYVKANGQYSDCYYDGRKILGANYEKGIVSGLACPSLMYRDDISDERKKEVEILKEIVINGRHT